MKGRIIALYGPVVDVQFKEGLPRIYEKLTTHNCEGNRVDMEVAGYCGEDQVRCIGISPTYGLRRGEEVESTGGPISIPDAETITGRIINVLGVPVDGEPAPENAEHFPIRRVMMTRKEAIGVEEPEMMVTGIKVLDLLFPLMKGSKSGIVGGAALGKSVLTLEIINNITKILKSPCVFCGAGERTREGNELFFELQEAGVLDRVSMTFGQMNESPGARFEIVNTGITLAESFQRKGEDVLLFIDNVYRYIQAGSELSTLLGRIPSESGYQATMVTEVGEVHERIRRQWGASITSVEAVYVPADDLTDPAVVTILAFLDASLVFSREYIKLGLYPAIDPLRSASSFMSAVVVGERHFSVGQEVKRVLRKFEDLNRLVAIVGLEELSDSDRRDFERAKRIRNFLTQPFFVAEAYTGKKGQYVTLEQTIQGCEKILRGDYDEVSEDKLYMLGALD